LKIDNWPQAIVAVSGLLTVGAVVVFLARAGWSDQAIAAFVTLALGLFAGQMATARKAATVEAKTDHQTDQLHTIVEQTNGRSEAELQDIADRAAVKVIEAYRNGGLR
jgi:hypothetical protein